jgi:ATP-dependent Clp protease ATP-binding subunit ClpC
VPSAHGHIGTGHIRPGIIRQGDGGAAQVLTGLGAGLDGAREQVIRILEQPTR